ncbi:hypothetical protein [Enterococcus olivae]
MIRIFLYLMTIGFILLSVLSPIHNDYQFFYMVGAIVSLVTLMFVTTFEKSDPN